MWNKQDNVQSETHDDDKRVSLKRSTIIFLILVVFALPLLWRWTPLREWINLFTIFEWLRSLREDPAAPFFVVATYLVGSLVFFPITVLTLATVFAFGPLWGNLYALAGWFLSSAQGYFLGRFIGNDVLHKLAGRRLSPFIDRVGQHGFLTVLTVRLVPVGPFTLVNMFLGASAIRFLDFSLASLVGRIPGVVTMTLFGVQVENALRKPGLTTYALLGVTLIVMPILFTRLFKRYLRARARRPSIE